MLYKMLFKIYNEIFLHKMQVCWPMLVFKAKIETIEHIETVKVDNNFWCLFNNNYVFNRLYLSALSWSVDFDFK